MEESGALQHLQIQAYKDGSYAEGDKLGAPFEAYVNPAEITLSYEHVASGEQAAGTTGKPADFRMIKPGLLTLAFFLDGTGANGRSIDVMDRIEAFQRVTGFNGEEHHPNFLKVAWGNLAIRRCVLKSATIAYKMFKPSGVPLRAVINATFVDAVDDPTRVAIQQESSPDLTHARVVKAGDTLPALCQKIYGDPRRYLAVAEANGLDDFRALVPGTRIFFPPIEK